MIILGCVYLLIGVVVIAYINKTVSGVLPSLEQLENPNQSFATQIYSSDGKLLDHFFKERRVWISIDSMPKGFLHALVATEDKNFYNHWGIHTSRIIQAAVKNTLRMRTREGASTITMQLARNLYFSLETTLSRKLKEAFTAIQIEKTHTKDEILEMYANTVAFGRGAYGIQVASQVYFDKSPMQLTTAECAFFVGILKAPENYNGTVDYEKAITRRNLVLDLMKTQKYINDAQYRQAVAEPLNLAKLKNKKNLPLNAPHFIEMVRQQLTKDTSMRGHNLYRDGLVIHTTLNYKMQQYAEEVVTEHLAKYQETFNKSWSWSSNRELLSSLIDKAVKNNPNYIAATQDKKDAIKNSLKSDKSFIDSVKNAATTVQIGLVVIEPATGAILAMVGSSPKFMNEAADAKYSLNHAVQIRRQPGSSFKPFTYACALEEGLTPESMIESGPYTYKVNEDETWSPASSEKYSGGPVSLTTGLAASINTVAARLITQVTKPQNVVEKAHLMGIESPLKAVPALSLGAGGEVTPLELTSAFGTFANEGLYVHPYSIMKIEDQYGNDIPMETNKEIRDALDPKIARKMTEMLETVIQSGTAYTIKNMCSGFDAAGKTGTTNDYADAWFVGFTPQLAAGVWVGFDDRRITFTGGYGYAAKAAAPVWGMMMKKIYADPRLPYKQRKFSFKSDITIDSSAIQRALDDYQVENPSGPPTQQQQIEIDKQQQTQKPKVPDSQRKRTPDVFGLLPGIQNEDFTRKLNPTIIN